jgi:hypothetical protein
MKNLYGYHFHRFVPKEFRKTQDITGDHELDASIHHCHNGDLPHKLRDYVTGDESYGPITGYSGYEGYRGDN